MRTEDEPPVPRAVRTQRAAAPGRTGVTRLPRAAASLRHRDFRLLIIGLTLANTGYWALVVAQGWLVLQLTDSKLVLGAVNACLSLPFLLIALPAGVVADRADRKRLLTITRCSLIALMTLLSVLTLSDVITVWLLGLIVFAAGCTYATDLPLRQSLVPEMVDPDEVTNAVAVNQMVFTGTTLIGPTVGGAMLAWTGPGGAFAITAVGNAALLVLVRMMRFPPRATRGERRAVTQEIGEGLRYVLGHPVLQPLVVLSACLAVLVQPYQSFLPALAKDTLRVGAGTLGVLFAAGGVGAITGALIVAALGDVRRKGWVVLTGSLAAGVLVIGVAASRSLPLTLALLAGAGLANAINSTMNSTVLVTTAPAALRGRVMSINVLVFGLSPLGNLVLGALADALDVPAALAISAGVFMAVVVVTALTRPRLRAM